MEEHEASSLKEQNKYLKEATFSSKSDTAGLLYAPYRVLFDEQTRTIQFIDNTLRDIARDELLIPTVVWLLGYDAREPIEKHLKDEKLKKAPIRAQAEGSHWETGWCLIQFLDARPILADRYPSIVQEIDRRLCDRDSQVNPLHWLLNEAIPIDQDEAQVYWYGKQDDSVVATLALLRARAERNLKLPNQLKTDLDQVLPKALRWLYAELYGALVNIDVDAEPLTMLEPLIYADEHFTSILLEVWPDSYAAKREELYVRLDKWFSHIEARLASRKEGMLTHFLFGAIEAACLCRLIFLWQRSDPQKREHFQLLIERAKILLLYYIEFVEEALARDPGSGTLYQVRQLSVYVDACRITGILNQKGAVTTSTSTANAQMVLKVLSTVKNEFFSNGSIFHSVYPTVYFLRSLISICNWPEAEKTIARLYYDLLDKFIIRASVERKENFELNRLLIERDRDLANGKERYSNALEHHRWLRRGFIAIIAFIAIALLIGWVMPLLHFGYLNVNLVINPGSGEGFIYLIATCAGTAGLVGYVIDRFLTRREQ